MGDLIISSNQKNSFEHLELGTEINFGDNKIGLSQKADSTIGLVTSEHLHSGNVCLLGTVERKTANKLSFVNCSDCMTLPPLDEIEELFSFLS